MIRRLPLLCLLTALASYASAEDAAAPESKPGATAPESEAHGAKILRKDPKGCTWIESEATVEVGEQETRHQARASAMNEARRIAMQDFLGVNVTSRFMDYQQEGLRDERGLTESLVQTTRNGRVLKEKLISQKWKDASDCTDCRFYVKLHSCLMPLPQEQDKDFRVDLELSRERFVQGDQAKLTVTPTRDAYIYVYDVGMSWETSLIVPNDKISEVQGQVLVKAGQTWHYPPPGNKTVTLEAALPDDKAKISAETIRVIATKAPIARKIMEPGADGYLGVLQRMNDAKTEWAEDVQAFTIYRR